MADLCQHGRFPLIFSCFTRWMAVCIVLRSRGFVTLAKRRIGTDNWEVRHTAYRGKVSDGHNIISLGVDRDGYLHVAFDHHGHPLHYARSIAPGSLSLGPLEPMVGRNEQDVTYPEFYPLPSGKMLFVYRSGFRAEATW